MKANRYFASTFESFACLEIPERQTFEPGVAAARDDFSLRSHLDGVPGLVLVALDALDEVLRHPLAKARGRQTMTTFLAEPIRYMAAWPAEFPAPTM